MSLSETNGKSICEGPNLKRLESITYYLVNPNMTTRWQDKDFMIHSVHENSLLNPENKLVCSFCVKLSRQVAREYHNNQESEIGEWEIRFLPVLQTDVESMRSAEDVAILLASFSHNWGVHNR
jgi:hypothetical protein